jgi:multidrug resistance efflux pump
VRWREFRQTWLPYLVFAAAVVGAVVLWRQHSARATIVGQAEAIRTSVVAARAGAVAALQVDLLQPVKRGELVAQLAPADLEVVTSTLVAATEKLRAELGQSADRNLVNYQGLRLDWLRRNVELASARVEQQLAESEYQRYAALHANHTVSDAEFELRRANRDALKDKVTGLERLSRELESEIARLQPGGGAASPIDRAISAAAAAQEKQLAALAEASRLRAPMDGFVSAIFKRPGENALLGEPVLSIGASHASRIVAYVRQPLHAPPQVGDLVDVQLRRSPRTKAAALVLRVGAQLEPIDPLLLPGPADAPRRVTELGLPLLIEIPARLTLTPGEIVTLSSRPLAAHH